MVEPKRDRNLLAMAIPIGKLLPWGALALLAVVTATFTLTRLSTSDREAALETQLTAKNESVRRVEAQNPLRLPTSSLPGVTLANAHDLPELRELAERVANLEAERSKLLSELVSRTEGSLDPASELAGLLHQLDSSEEDSQEQALAGLFDLRNPRSFLALVSYFGRDSDRATRRFSIFDWLNFLWRLDPQSGMEFAIGILESDDTHHSYAAYRKLRSDLNDLALLEGARQPLEQVALQSESPLARTRAKLLLEALPNWRTEIEKRDQERAEYERQLDEHEKQSDPRNIPEMLRDIEKAISELAGDRTEPK